ncbi:putative Acid phosphatase [Helianthus annuus]|uniref:Acid phosphatase n=1 Tax=Helianthus annuus TaxID=4232 RepID=A0A9K3J2E0_HELAN|nr:putative Acid phosphatase [Helianthus annuus]KAJ0585604.1 putative Acid phosphatase [Helianthus annuus]KAJ0923845.1 putative Acid phosphatase [Helianthus annuus]
MVSLESLLYAASVDIVFVGHMNAYERSTRVYNGKSEPCGPIQLIIGNGGNKEGIATR